MSINILMPALSPTMEEGTLAKWLVKEGDEVNSGDLIAEIETDKATMEVEAVDEGVIGKILVSEGQESIKVNQPIAVLLEKDESLSDLVIENNVTGWLVEPRNSKVLADKIIEVFSLDPKRKDLIVRNAQKKIREKFSLPNMLNQTLGIYEELIERKKNFNN